MNHPFVVGDLGETRQRVDAKDLQPDINLAGLEVLVGLDHHLVHPSTDVQSLLSWQGSVTSSYWSNYYVI